MFVIPEEEIMGYLKKVFFIFLLVYFVFSLTTTVSQELIRQKTMVESAIVVKLESPLKNYKGECPVEVKMTGKIIASSDSKLRYRFTRSDGVSSRWMILKYTEKFTKTVPFSWKINSNYKGWVQLLVRVNRKLFKSKKVSFEVACIPSMTDKVKVPNEDKIVSITRPDLIVGDIHPNPPNEKIVCRKMTNFSWVVWNKGFKSSPPCDLLIQIFKDSNPVPVEEGYEPIPAISPGSSFSYGFFWSFNLPGGWTIKARIDAKSVVTESNELNNRKSYSFMVLK